MFTGLNLYYFEGPQKDYKAYEFLFRRGRGLNRTTTLHMVSEFYYKYPLPNGFFLMPKIDVFSLRWNVSNGDVRAYTLPELELDFGFNY